MKKLLIASMFCAFPILLAAQTYFDYLKISERKGEYTAGIEKPRMPINELKRLIVEMEKQMKQAASDLQFEQAAVIRDRIIDLKTYLAEESDLPPWKKARLMAGEIE